MTMGVLSVGLTVAEARALLDLELPSMRIGDPLLTAVVKLAGPLERLAAGDDTTAEPTPAPRRQPAAETPPVPGLRRGTITGTVLAFMCVQGGTWTATAVRHHPEFPGDFSVRQVHSAFLTLSRAGSIVPTGEKGVYRLPGEPTPVERAVEDREQAKPFGVGESDPIKRTAVNVDAARKRAAFAMSSGDAVTGGR